MTITPLALFSVPTWLIVMIVILVILIAGIVALSIWGKKQQKKMDDAQVQIDANSQNVTMLELLTKAYKIKGSRSA